MAILIQKCTYSLTSFFSGNCSVVDPYSFFLRIRIRIQSLMLETNTDPDTDPDPIQY
jgi:hypothetical protein